MPPSTHYRSLCTQIFLVNHLQVLKTEQGWLVGV